jgi:ParB family chromosome partitioning protein
MSRQHIYLKTETQYFQAVENGSKEFEVRKNDRGYKLGDIVYLQETVNGVYTGRVMPGCEVIYILLGGQYGIDPDYCVMQLKIMR